MPYYRQIGEVPPKRHTQFRTPDGGLYAEELIGQYGFSGASSLLYHQRPPTAMVGAPRADDTSGEEEPGRDDDLRPNHPLTPFHLHTGEVPTGTDLVTGRRGLLANPDLRVAVAVATSPSPFYRDADGDELIYIRRGSLRLESVFGALDCHSGDYVVIPAGATHRWLPAGEGPAHVLVLELRGHIGPPDRYLSPQGQFLEHSPYCERDLHGPEEPLVAADTGRDDGPADVLVARDGLRTWFRYAHHPFDVVAWDGCVYPHRLSIHDFEPLTGRVHQPPPVHQTFAAPGVVVCSFVPRKLDYHPEAVPAPYNHSNVDSDELIYYCDGDFTSRKGAGIAPGSLTLHPGGHTHGPQPGSVEASLGATETTELAVMVDTFRPLQLTAAARDCADPDYPFSWIPSASS